MPTFTARKSTDVPAASRTSSAARKQQALYESFIRDVPGDSVGELELSEGETARGIRTRLRRASSRLGRTIEVWDAEGIVYFQAAAPKRRSTRQSKSSK